jgi:tRNA-specific 2-thiouridylase
LATGVCNWLVQPDTPEFPSQIKVRYRQPDQACQARIRGDGALEVRFENPQRAVTPGQFAVLYDGDRCLGGGVIEGTAAQ